MQPRIGSLILDFGNVVGFFDHRRTAARLAPHTDLDVESLHQQLYGGSLETAYELGRISTDEFLREAKDRGRIRCSLEEIATAWGDIFWPNPAILPLIRSLDPRLHLLLASNTNETHARHFRGQFAETLGRFNDLVFSHEVNARKPDQAFFQACQARLPCRPSECLFLDDLPANVEGARAFGWEALVYEPSPEFAARLAARLGVSNEGCIANATLA